MMLKLISKSPYILLVGLFLIVFAGCRTAQDPTQEDLVTDSRQAQETISSNYPEIGELFRTSAGYVIFPNVGKGAYIIGGSSGNGTVYENGSLIGYADLKQLDVGLQVGAKSFVEVLFFQTQAELNEFKTGEYKLAGDASAVVLDEGVAGGVEFEAGVAVVTMPKEGVMAGVSVGGQRFEFIPAN